MKFIIFSSLIIIIIIMYAPDLRRGPTTTTFLGTATYITEP